MPNAEDARSSAQDTAGAMLKEVIVKDDGRSLIYYTFPDSGKASVLPCAHSRRSTTDGASATVSAEQSDS